MDLAPVLGWSRFRAGTHRTHPWEQRMGFLLRLDRLRVEHPIFSYVFALLLTLICLILTLLVEHYTDRSMFQLAVVGVVLSAWYGGLGPGLLSAFLLSLGTAYFMLEPRFSFVV